MIMSGVCLIGVPEGQTREHKGEALFYELPAENSSDLMKYMNPQIQEVK